MLNASKKNFLPPLASKYGKSTTWSTQQCHQANGGESGLDAEKARALGALRSLRSNKKLVAEKRWETHFWSNEEKAKWIEDYVERYSAGAKKIAEDAETAVQQGQKETMKGENVGLTNRQPEKNFQKMMFAVGDSLRDLASSENGPDADDGDNEDEEETE